MLGFKQFSLSEANVIVQSKLDAYFKSQSVDYYKKIGTVEARLGKKGEHIVTIVNGTKETSNTIKNDDDDIIKNPAGEEYNISKSKYNIRYSGPLLTDNYQPVKSVGGCYACKWILGKSKIQAESGESMLIEYGDFIATTNKSETGKYYRIEKSAFKETYKKDGKGTENAK